MINSIAILINTSSDNNGGAIGDITVDTTVYKADSTLITADN